MSNEKPKKAIASKGEQEKGEQEKTAKIIVLKETWNKLPKRLKRALKVLAVSSFVLFGTKQGFEKYIYSIIVPNENNLDNFKLMYPDETVDFLKTLVKFYEKDSTNNVFNSEVNDEVMSFLSRVKEECTNGIFSEQGNLSFVRTALISELNKDLPQNPIIDMQYAEGICTIRFSDGTHQSFYAEKAVEDVEAVEKPKILPDKFKELLEAEQKLGEVINNLKSQEEDISDSNKEELVNACEAILINGAYEISYNKNTGEIEVNYKHPLETKIEDEVRNLCGIKVKFDSKTNVAQTKANTGKNDNTTLCL